MTRRRLSICYAAPGQNLVPWAGPTRNVLSAAEALSEWADVTVAFRRTPHPTATNVYRVIAIEPQALDPTALADDNAARGIHPVQHLGYCRTLRSFARRNADAFDVVLEKGWRLSGFLSAAFLQSGVPAVIVENDIRSWTEAVDGVRQFSKYALHGLAHVVTGACSRRVPAVIAETDELKTMLISRLGIAAGRIHVVGLGVDHRLFRPMNQASSRHALGIRPDSVIMLYVGAMDEYHDLAPVIEGLAHSSTPVELHVVGDGEYRARYEAAAAAAGIACRFFGRVPQGMVPQFISAADICIAPYRTAAFPNGLVPFSTLKVPEYMACARPVAGEATAGTRKLIVDGVSGFILSNDVASWRTFLGALPSRERLASIGAAAAQAVAHVTWAGTAASYLDVCERVVSFAAGSDATRIADPASLAR